jgi:hypothetical protein
MATFFSYYPKTFYTSNNNTAGLESVTNLITRFKFDEGLKQNSSAFYKYNIQDSDTPEIIADKYYGDVEKHWVVLLFNDIVDPQWDWPLNSRQVVEYIDKKYTANGAANTTVQTGIAWALNQNNVQGYFKIVTTTAFDGTQRIEKLEVDQNTYANIAASTTSYTTQAGESVTIAVTKETQTYYDYEIELNESKREIKLLKSDFVDAINKEFKRVITQ